MSTDLLEFVWEIYKRKDEGKLKDVIYLDFVKEFDKVPQKISQEFQPCGIRGQIGLLPLVESWFSDRRRKEGMGDKQDERRAWVTNILTWRQC